MVKVSVIIPTHNRSEMLCKAIDSVLIQKNVLTEVIVVDDCSTDDTNSVIHKYPNVIYYRNEYNLGPGNSRKKGFLLSDGDYVVFLDDDDFYTCDIFFEKAIEILEKDNRLSFVSGMVDIYDMNDDLTKEVNFDLNGSIDGKTYLNAFQIKYPKPLSTFPTVFSKAKLKNAELSSMVEVNDSSIYMRALTQGDAYILDLKIGSYRVHKSNITKGLNPELIIRNLHEKEYIIKRWRHFIENPSDWWYLQFKLTYNYFSASQPSVNDRIKVLLWGFSHENSSLKMFVFLIKHFMGIFQGLMKSILFKIYRIPVYLRHYLCNEIVINGYFFYNEDGTLKNNNFGDDINFPLLNELTGRKVIQEWKVGLRNLENLVCIGSVIDCCNERSVIWGTGAISENILMKHTPKRVYAVRGPLTRQKLLSSGIDCPEVYGDPALLLPLIYSPKVEKKYKYGFIPHYVDYDLPHVIEFRENHPEILFIKFEEYSSWQSVIDQINSCECIISSSLHGLIVSDAYKIPNTRIILSDNIVGGDFKYKDYFGGVGREYTPPIDCREQIQFNEIVNELNKYQTVHFDVQSLLKVFPYKLKSKYQVLKHGVNQ